MWRGKGSVGRRGKGGAIFPLIRVTSRRSAPGLEDGGLCRPLLDPPPLPPPPPTTTTPIYTTTPGMQKRKVPRKTQLLGIVT